MDDLSEGYHSSSENSEDTSGHRHRYSADDGSDAPAVSTHLSILNNEELRIERMHALVPRLRCDSYTRAKAAYTLGKSILSTFVAH